MTQTEFDCVLLFLPRKDSLATMWLPHFLLLHTTWLKESTLCQQTKLVHTTNVCGRGMLPRKLHQLLSMTYKLLSKFV